MKNVVRAFALVAMVLAGCGDNLGIEGGATKQVSSSTSVGGGQVAHSKSFTLVTSVGNTAETISHADNFTLKSGVGQ